MNITYHDVTKIYSIGMFCLAVVCSVLGRYDRATFFIGIAIYFKD